MSRDYQRALRRRYAAQPTPDHVHGTANGYDNYACRCSACRNAHALYRLRERRAA